MRHWSMGLLLCLVACEGTPSTYPLFAIDGTGDDFYALPFPNDHWRKPDGTLDLSLFPVHSTIADQYRAAAESLDGFGLNAAIFVRFSGEIDPATLPDPAASTQPGASVYLVNIDSASPHVGERTPVIAHFRLDRTDTMGNNRLAVRPYPGFPLDEGTTYALVVTDRVHSVDGTPVAADERFVRGAALDAFLATNSDHVVGAAVFTTQHATNVGLALRKAVFAQPAPIATNVTDGGVSGGLDVWTGAYMAPNFQTGMPPYLDGGGEIQVGADGAAVVQRTEAMRFALTVPVGTMPSTGWPICIYQHGTGGDYKSFIDDGTAARLAAEGIAVISTDQVLHGPRSGGSDPAVAFFNFGNPLAARDNSLQGAADAWSQLRLAVGLRLPGGGKLDPARVSFFGHSQGGLTGPAFIAFEPSLSGAVLSGTGGLLYLSMLYKTEPVDFQSLIAAATRDQPIDEDNPSLALAQMWIERADGANYARHFERDLADGVTARNIFQTEGFTDTYAPNPSIEAFATAVGGDIVKTADAKDLDGIDLRGGSIKAAPITGNMMGGATAVLAQYKQASGSDGHFVVFDIAAAQTQSSKFLGTLAATGKATVVTP